jgi:hypothetical protein
LLLFPVAGLLLQHRLVFEIRARRSPERTL